MERMDIKLDAGDVLIADNDLVFGLSDEQHIEDTINASSGWWKENFADGVGIRNYLNSSGQQQVLARAIKVQLESDLYTVTNPKVDYSTDGKLIIAPNATI